MAQFTLDPQLEGDSLPLAELELCSVRLMNDANFVWLLMVPQRSSLVELIDLARGEQHLLMDEIRQVSQALQQATGCDKLNVAQLGNQVRQLHVHVIARNEGDGAWPGPIWGKLPARPYSDQDAEKMIETLRAALL
ncbi:Diadenosine tetraphosphate (Ap4A) hydrolase [Cohaesibacter sp. ES.047]|uniref:HIT family protein n=1 Tax=Cohaesibacter sp. ES.047 TaxID=1798205 RepID=UPI000BB7DEB9|nr:HIT family protein [Cohaesibacter sp. ES.047]SNY91849.1 Diadenosine tetraphosphate (Ap4A) hydrolase [Cohaesibacter sp. ES.047]